MEHLATRKSIYLDSAIKRSPLACHTCKRRKVKCDKKLPFCTICSQNFQPCSYPQSAGKPGPKLGSHHNDNRNNGGTQFRGKKHKLQDKDRLGSSVTRNRHNKRHQLKDFSPDTGRDIVASWIMYHFHDQRPYQNADGGLRYSFESSHQRSSLYSSRVIQRNNALLISSQMGISLTTLYRLIDSFFDNMSFYSLFHRPTFKQLIFCTLDAADATILLSAMFIFATRFEKSADFLNLNLNRSTASEHFHRLASQMLHPALDACGDEAPPLYMLQALILMTYYELISKVQGKSWRSLGNCIRIGYELNLHEVDISHWKHPASANWSGLQQQNTPTDVDVNSWRLAEERRRAWWMMFEFDIFVSTIRKAPTAIYMNRIATWLPVDDESWFQDKYKPSCFLDIDPMKRLKTLANIGSTSPQAWYIISNSLMHEAHELTNIPPNLYQSLSTSSDTLHTTRDLDSSPPPQSNIRRYVGERCMSELSIIEHCLSCVETSLPSRLKFQGQLLQLSGHMENCRSIDSSVVQIYIMTQLGKMMVYHVDSFPVHQLQPTLSDHRYLISQIEGLADICDNASWKQYMTCANNIIQILRYCIPSVSSGPATFAPSSPFCGLINPISANVFWIVGAAQIFEKCFTKCKVRRQLAQSNYDMIKVCLAEHERFWDSSDILTVNLNSLEVGLKGLLKSEKNRPPLSIDSDILASKTVTDASDSYSHSYIEKNTMEPSMSTSSSSISAWLPPDFNDSWSSSMVAPGAQFMDEGGTMLDFVDMIQSSIGSMKNNRRVQNF